MVSEAQYKDTIRASETLDNSLQELLVARDKQNLHTSYINQWWFDMYTQNRDPLVINVNPQIRLRDDPVLEKNQQLQRLTSLISSSVKFFRTLRDKKLEPDIFHTKKHTKNSAWFDAMCSMLPESIAFYGAAALGAYPLDMSQYKNLFQSTRIPHLDNDSLQVFPNSRHIVVQYGSAFFTIDVLDKEGNAVPDEAILKALEHIVDRPVPSGPGIGVLTTLDRDSWATERQHLVENATNKASLDAIDQALFAVCISLAFFLFSLWVWKTSIKKYSSASS